MSAWDPIGRVAAATACLGYALAFSMQSCVRHWMFLTNALDMAHFVNAFHNFWRTGVPYSTVHGVNVFGLHFSPILLVPALCFRLAPFPETLLILQSAALAGTGLLLYLLAHRKTGSPLAAAGFTLIGLSSPFLHETNLFDFHEIVFGAPLLVWIFLALEAGSPRLAVLGMALLICTKENQSVVLFVVGLWLGLARGRWRAGLALMLASAAAGVLLVGWLIPWFRGAPYYYTHLFGEGRGFLGLLQGLLTEPWRVAALLYSPEKLWTCLRLLLPVAFLPFFSRSAVLLLVGAEFLLGTSYPLRVLGAHYGCIPATMTAISAVYGYAALRRRLPRLASVLLLCGVAYALQDAARRLPERFVRLELDAHKRLAYRLLGRIPQGVAVAADNHYTPHLARRPSITIFPIEVDRAEFVLLDLKDPHHGLALDRYYFYLGKLCWLGQHSLIHREDGFLLFRKAPNRPGSMLPLVLVELDRVWGFSSLWDRLRRSAPWNFLSLWRKAPES